jgi:hypothetical protein
MMFDQPAKVTKLRNAKYKIKAGEANYIFGCRRTGCNELTDTSVITYIQEGAYCVFHNVDFGEGDIVTGFCAGVKTACTLGWIEIRLDDINGPRVGLCQVAARDLGLEQWGTVRSGIYGASGIHNVYLKFTGFTPCGFELDWFKFTMDEAEIRGLLENQPIPPRVPYLGTLEKYFIGSGIAGAGGDTQGVWDYLIGPDYTFYGYIKSCESYIKKEEIRLVIDGVEEAGGIEMRRVRGNCMFCGVKCVGDLTVHLIDFCNMGESWVSRTVMVVNNSLNRSYDIAVRAYITPAGIADSIVDDTAVTISHGCEERINKNVTITFTDSTTLASNHENFYIVETGTKTIFPKNSSGDRYTAALYHYVHRDEKTARQSVDYIRNKTEEPMIDDIKNCIKQWRDWLSKDDSIDKLPDQKVKDAVEGALIIMKMLQGRDGGIMATARNYMDSYARDSAGCLTGLIAAGHTEEAEKFMLWVEHKFNVTRMIPCNADIGDDAAYFAGYGSEDNWAAETPALYLLTARDYLQRMKKQGEGRKALEFFHNIDGSLRYAVNVQLQSLIKNNWKLRFNGDETESGGSGIKLKDGPIIEQYWSMPSLALCAASLKFFINYLSENEENPEEYLNNITGQVLNLLDVLDIVKKSLDDNFWRTDLIELGGGFYDWYKTQEGEWPQLRITNYTLFPIFYGTPLNYPKRAFESAEVIKGYFKDKGFLPIQPGGLSEDYCGHNLGYLLYALVEKEDPMMEQVFDALMNGKSIGCWGTWSEAYKAEGETYMRQEKGSSYTTSNMRPFETGVNIAAIFKYLKYHEGLKD